MDQNLDKDRVVVRYLLGELSDEEQVRLEEKYFGDDEFFEQVLVVEDELIDAYVGGELSARERELFEKRFSLSEKHHQRLAFARLLNKSQTPATAADRTGTPAPEPVSWWRSGFGFLRAQNPIIQFAPLALLLLIALALFSLVRWRQQSGPSQSLAQQQENREPPPANVRPKQNSQGRPPATLLLVPGSVRSVGTANTLSIPTDAEQATVQIILEEDSYKLYRAEIKRVGGHAVPLLKDGLVESQATDAGERALVLKIPAQLLAAGDYQLRLGGVTAGQKTETIADYNFRVVKK
ncbi:MAG: hypothetical protein QOD00_2446 [Blastocatellia bacterium]|nr:hypothetical protein [Blastocatellia bacterium]